MIQSQLRIFLKNLGIKAEKELINIYKQTYESGMWPDDFKKSTFIPLMDLGQVLKTHVSKIQY